MQHEEPHLKCYKCNFEIKSDKAKKAMDKIFHDNCFQCSKCSIMIPEWYYTKNNRDAVCHKCVENDQVTYDQPRSLVIVSSTTGDIYNPKAPMCSVCNTGIQGKFAIKVNNKMMHNTCFTCHHCKKLIKDYYQTDEKDRAICQDCVIKTNGGENGVPSCAKCKKSIDEENFIPFWGVAFHEKCFRCSICGKCLIKKALRLMNGRLTCAGHLLQDEKQIPI